MEVETIFSNAGVSIVTQPYLVGQELEILSQKASEDWIRSLDLSQISNPVSLEILNGGHYYYVADAYQAVTNKQCHASTLKAKRGHASAVSYGGPAWNNKKLPPGADLWQSQDSDWCVRIWDQSKWVSGPLLVGDTIATGTTLAGVLGWYVKKMEACRDFNDIYVFTIAGAAQWDSGGKDGSFLDKMSSLDAKLRTHGKKLHITFCNAQFCLQPNGTDLAFKDAKWDLQAKALVEAKIPQQFWPSMRCAVWDWGDRFTKISHHLHELKEWFDKQKNCPAWIMEGIAERLLLHQSKNTLKRNIVTAEAELFVKKLSPHAIIPIRGSTRSAGYDLSSAHDITIPGHGKGIAKTDLAIALPSGTYGRVAPRSGLAWKKHVDVGAGVIDEDYRGNVGVVLFNHSNNDLHIKTGDRVAQLILENCHR